MGLIGMPREVCLLGLQILVQRFDSASGLQLIAFENDCCLAFSFLIRVAARVITLWSRTAEIPDHSRKAYYCIGLAFASDSLLPPLFVALSHLWPENPVQCARRNLQCRQPRQQSRSI